MPKLPAILIAGALVLSGCTPTEERAPTAGSPPVAQSTPPPAPPSPSAQPGPGTATPSPSPVPEEDKCGAARFQNYVGQPYSTETAARILATVGHLRTIRPGDAVTMDFRADRLNMEIGEDGRITRFRCG